MIVKLIKGHSFKGAAAYLLHDKGALTDERVAWTQTRNIESDKPEVAWRVMAATAMDSDRLKAEAGIPNTGRKSTEDVLHLVLSWHPEEKPDLDRDQMLAAAEGAIASLKANDRQAIIIAHNDTDAPHVHVLMNKVSPDDGRKLPSKYEKRNLSKWALKYRKDRGQEHYCPDRLENDRAYKKRGDHTKHKDKPRNLVEAEKVARGASNDNSGPIEQLSAKLRERTRILGAKSRTTRNRHVEAWAEFEKADRARREKVRQDTAAAYKRDRMQLAARTKSLSRELARTEAKETALFIQREQTTLGRLRNAMQVITPDRSIEDGDRLKLLTKNFANIFTSADRARLLNEQQEQRREALDARHRTADRKLRSEHAKERRERTSEINTHYEERRSELRFTQAGENAALKAQWRTLAKVRERSFQMLASAYERSKEARQEFDNVSVLDRIHARADELRQQQAQEQDNTRDRDNENDNDR